MSITSRVFERTFKESIKELVKRVLPAGATVGITYTHQPGNRLAYTVYVTITADGYKPFKAKYTIDLTSILEIAGLQAHIGAVSDGLKNHFGLTGDTAAEVVQPKTPKKRNG